MMGCSPPSDHILKKLALQLEFDNKNGNNIGKLSFKEMKKCIEKFV